jgi:hypothetical protein
MRRCTRNSPQDADFSGPSESFHPLFDHEFEPGWGFREAEASAVLLDIESAECTSKFLAWARMASCSS